MTTITTTMTLPPLPMSSVITLIITIITLKNIMKTRTINKQITKVTKKPICQKKRKITVITPQTKSV
jgi:hypothetical protein